MTRRRRALLLIGLALVLGALAASDVARREAGLEAQLGPAVAVVVARAPLPAGRTLRAADLSLRRVPRRYAPVEATPSPEALVGRRLAVPVARHGTITPSLIDLGGPAGPPVRRGERAADVVAAASPAVVVPGARVDVLVTREGQGGAPAGAQLALEDVEVLAAAAAPPGAAGSRDDAGPRVTATLRVTVRQAVYLAAAQAFARDVRLLARAPGDRRRVGAVAVGEGLR